MPCKCSGIRYDKCNCRVVGTGFQIPNGDNSRIMILQNQSACCVHSIEKPKRSVFIRIFECLYDKCAGYNLRYCPIRGIRTKNCVNEALRDILLLLCFLLANFIVFLTIFARMTMHLSAILVQSAGWLRRSVVTKMIENKNTLAVSSTGTLASHNFAPPHNF